MYLLILLLLWILCSYQFPVTPQIIFNQLILSIWILDSWAVLFTYFLKWIPPHLETQTFFYRKLTLRGGQEYMSDLILIFLLR